MTGPIPSGGSNTGMSGPIPLGGDNTGLTAPTPSGGAAGRPPSELPKITVFLVSVALLILSLYLSSDAVRLQRELNVVGAGKSWSYGSVVIVLGLGFVLQLPVINTALWEFAPVLLVASITPAAIGFINFAQLTVLADARTVALRATISQFVAFINFAASIATLILFFRSVLPSV